MSIKLKILFAYFLACVAIIFVMVVHARIYEIELKPGALLIFSLMAIGVALPFAFWSSKMIQRRIDALSLGLLNLQDGEFNTHIRIDGQDEFTALAEAVNKASDKLRSERESIYHRELLLDKVNQNSPVAMLLIDDSQHIIYSNQSAREWLNKNKSMEGNELSQISEQWPDNLKQAMRSGKDGVFSINLPSYNESSTDGNSSDTSDMWHLSTGSFVLNAQHHRLYLLKQMTREFNRQEVAVWKKVLRIISHELNNSIAPISSMTHSGKLILDSNKLESNLPKLALIFKTIESRTQHLNEFITNYAKFARLPEPKPTKVEWEDFIHGLQLQFIFKAAIESDSKYFTADKPLMEQLFINVLKNSHESGSAKEDIEICVKDTLDKVSHSPNGTLISILDKGPGMPKAVLENALLPFYSTKQNGSGIGLALCREIAEAHQGEISIQNRDKGGLCVNVWLPRTEENYTH